MGDTFKYSGERSIIDSHQPGFMKRIKMNLRCLLITWITYNLKYQVRTLDTK